MRIFLAIAAMAPLLVFPGSSATAQETMTSSAPAAASPSMSAPATNSRTRSSAAKPASRAAEILQRFDKNGDGRLDEDEKADAHEMMLDEQMAKGTPPAVARGASVFPALALELFDRDRDNRLDENERLDAIAFIQQSGDALVRKTLLKRFDQNADGKLDKTERHESEAYVEEHRGELMQEILLERYDANASGQLDAPEKTLIREAFLKMPPGEAERTAAQTFASTEAAGLLRAELEKRFDKNGNGRLDPDEQQAAKDYRRDHRGEILHEVMLERFDQNADGFLDDTERATMHRTLKAQRPDSP